MLKGKFRMTEHPRKMTTAIKYTGLIFLFGSLSLITGCTPSGNRLMSNELPKESRPNEPLRQLNPHPKHAFQVDVTLDHPPGDFQEVSAAVLYDVENLECGRVHPMTGSVPRMSSSESFKLNKISKDRYSGIFYSDMILDGDYFNQGLCKWKMSAVSVAFYNSAKDITSGYSLLLEIVEDQAEASNTHYYWNGHYQPSGTLPRFISGGHQKLNDDQKARIEQYFRISAAEKKIN